jgi:hypothetical protein
MASGPADTGNLPGDNGGKLQSLALELRNSAQIILKIKLNKSLCLNF